MGYYEVIWEGHSSADYSFALSSIPSFPSASVRASELYIPGRDGAIITNEGLSNFDITLDFVCLATRFNTALTEVGFRNLINTFFFSPAGEEHRHKLIFPSRQEWYNAEIVSDINFEDFAKCKTASVTFRCQPMAYPYAETSQTYHPFAERVELSNLREVSMSFDVSTICGRNNEFIARKPKMVFLPMENDFSSLQFMYITMKSTGTSKTCYVGRKWCISPQKLYADYPDYENIGLLFDTETDEYLIIDFSLAETLQGEINYDDYIEMLKRFSVGSLTHYMRILETGDVASGDLYLDTVTGKRVDEEGVVSYVTTNKPFRLWHEIEFLGNTDIVTIYTPYITVTNKMFAVVYQPEARLR